MSKIKTRRCNKSYFMTAHRSLLFRVAQEILIIASDIDIFMDFFARLG